MLITTIRRSLSQLTNLLEQLKDSEYSKPCLQLSNSTVGQHTRHIIEMFECLENQYKSGIVNYDKRQRNILVETNTGFAIQKISEILNNLGSTNMILTLQQIVGNEEIFIESNYHRELLYNLEHCIHHQALIKVALLQCEDVVINSDFGVAASTLEYRKQCVL